MGTGGVQGEGLHDGGCSEGVDDGIVVGRGVCDPGVDVVAEGVYGGGAEVKVELPDVLRDAR